MTDAAVPEGRQVVGLQPWLPWPLAASRWWTEPVRAEYLAVLRIGLAAVLLWDIVCVYWPLRHDFFGPDSLGSPEIFAYLVQDKKCYWSLLRGFADPLLSALALLAWLGSTAFVLVGLRARLGTNVPDPPTLRWALVVWLVSVVVGVLGLWVRLAELPPPVGDADQVARTVAVRAGLVLRVPLVVFAVALVFLFLGLWRRSQAAAEDRWVWPGLLACAGATGLLVVAGWLKWQTWTTDPAGPDWLRWTQTRWLAEPRAIDVGMAVWVGATLLLLLGLGTRVAAVAVWALGQSFDNLNFSITNAGDQVRSIITFYLMLCPCGAAWSLDAWLARRWGTLRGVAYVSPWALRLLFVQLIYCYFMNGLFKYTGKDWSAGTSLYYVLGDVVLTRVSYCAVPGAAGNPAGDGVVGAGLGTGVPGAGTVPLDADRGAAVRRLLSPGDLVDDGDRRLSAVHAGAVPAAAAVGSLAAPA